jgi:hypothetical protein
VLGREPSGLAGSEVELVATVGMGQQAPGPVGLEPVQGTNAGVFIELAPVGELGHPARHLGLEGAACRGQRKGELALLGKSRSWPACLTPRA